MVKNYFLFLTLLLQFIPFSRAELSTCYGVYNEGGAPAVFESPECPRWTLPSSSEMSLLRRPSGCHVSLHQGWRPYQEDRTVCVRDIEIPFLERDGIKDIKVGIIGIFDGHNGAEASDMASRLVLDYFLLHLYFLRGAMYPILPTKSFQGLSYADANYQLPNLKEEKLWNNTNSERLGWISPLNHEGPFYLEILKESLLRTIHDIDAEFTKEALAKNIHSGSTATVVIVADEHILAANVGDSKSIICSENYSSSNKKAGDESKVSTRRRRHNNGILLWSQRKKYELANSVVPAFSVKELTKDHHPDRIDEKSRVQTAAGGYVSEWAGVPRVNGQLAVSRSIGDLPFKKYGVVSTPEVSDWRLLSGNDTFLVAGSDGVFEKLSTEDVCDILSNAKIRTQNSLSDSIIEACYREGTTDNMSVIVIPLRPQTEFTAKDEL